MALGTAAVVLLCSSPLLIYWYQEGCSLFTGGEHAVLEGGILAKLTQKVAQP